MTTQTTLLDIATVTELTAAIDELTQRLQPGDHLGFVGPLGAGKTTMIQQLGARLGVTSPIDSPTFTLRQSYPLSSTRKNSLRRLVHYDLYRLETESALAETGFQDDWHSREDLLVIEWVDRFPYLLQQLDFLVTIRVNHQTNHRSIEIKEQRP